MKEKIKKYNIKLTKQCEESIDIDNYSSYTLQFFVDKFNNFVKNNNINKFDDAKIYIEIDTGYGGSYDSPSIDAKLYAERPKTESELEEEIKILEERDELNKKSTQAYKAKLKLEREAKEKREYERLKKKFEGK